jgi:hypothetical protein
MSGHAVKVEAGKVSVVERGEGLSGLYAATDCSMIEVASTGKIAGVPVAIICDEEGLLKAEPTMNLTACDVVALATESAPMYLLGGGLVGTVSIVHDDELRGFTDAELASIVAVLRDGGFPM